MEEDSIEDGALKDYFEKGRKKKERKKKKDRKRADRDKANEKEEDTSGKQGEENKEGNQALRDPAKLTNINPSKEDVSQNNLTSIAIHSLDVTGTDSESGGISPFPPSKSERSHKINLDDEDDSFLEENFSFTPEHTSPSSLELSPDTDMSEETKSNQLENAEISQSQEETHELSGTSPSTVTIAQAQGANSQQELTDAEQVAVQEGELNNKNAPILTVEAFNKIAKASGEGTPLFRYKTRSEFFRTKEENYLKEMGRFQNDDGSYTISQSIATTIALALETEQRNRSYIYHQNEFQLSHLKGILEAANFAKQVRDDVTKNITEHIIAKLNKPVEESHAKLETFTKKIINKLDEHEKKLEDQKEHLTTRGFLSVTREEHEAEVAGYKIIALQEDNEALKNERDEMEGANKKLKEQFERLRGEKAVWQTKYLELLACKRPRDELLDTSGKKHKPDEPIQSSSSAFIATSSVASAQAQDHIAPQYRKHQSNINGTTSSSPDLAPLTSSSRSYKSWGNKKEPSDEDKEKLRKELGFEYNLWDSTLDRDQQAAVTLALWKRELRKRGRYVPDYGPEKLKAYGIEHDRNIKFSMKAYEHFRSLDRNLGYNAWTEDMHNEYDRHQNRNHVPRSIKRYIDIVNDPDCAAFVRCIPVDYYYYQVASDTPGFKSFQPKHTKSLKDKGIAKSQKEPNKSLSHKISHNSSSTLGGNTDSHSQLSTLYTWGGETLINVVPKKYSSEHLTLDEIAEVARLDELVGQIRKKWPPGFYVALRDKDINNARISQSQGHEVPKWVEGLAITEINSLNAEARRRYDDYQMQLIHARIVRITNTAAVEGEETNIDGPSGQGPI